MAGIVSVLGALFIALALGLRQADGTEIDRAIAGWVQQIDHAAWTTLMVGVSAVGYWPWSWLVLGTATIGLALVGRFREAGFVLATHGAWQLATAVKPMIARPRPSPEDDVRVLGQVAEFSFPSSHVVSYVALYGFLFFLAWMLLAPSRRRTVALIALGLLIGLVGISRVTLGHHWPSDVFGGYALGAAYLLVLIEAYRLLVGSAGRATETVGTGRA